jgi:hypothetical protein
MATEKNVYKEVWDTLSKVDVSEHTDNKGGLTYLSWAWAWGTLMKHYPEAEYFFEDEKFFPDGSCQVEAGVVIRGNDRRMWLPVMDYRNNAIMNPDARKISDTKMRCLTKCISMWGLGHYIYAGEDLPEDIPPKKEEAKAPKTPKKDKPKAPKTGESAKVRKHIERQEEIREGHLVRPDKSEAPQNKAVQVAMEALDAVVIPDLGFIKEVNDIETLRGIFAKNKADYEAMGASVFKKIRDDFNKRRAEIKKGSTNGAA